MKRKKRNVTKKKSKEEAEEKGKKRRRRRNNNQQPIRIMHYDFFEKMEEINKKRFVLKNIFDLTSRYTRS